MAQNIKGITVQIGAETTGLSKALTDVNKNAKNIQSELKQVEKLLKLDPKNTELLAQKQQLLTNAVENTREKLDRLKSTQEQVNDQFARGEISEGQYRAFQREIAKTESELGKLEKQLRDMEPPTKSFAERMDEAGKKMQDAGKKMSDIGDGMSKKVTAPIVAAGAAMVAVGNEFDSAFDNIRIGTGATGDALEALKDDFRAVAADVPASFGDVSTAIADYNTRLGLTGEGLQDLSKQTLELVRITGGDLSKTIEETSQSFQAFNIPAEGYGDALDFIFRTSQSTGIGIDRLQSNMVKFAPSLKQLGIGFEESATLMGQLDKAGVDVEQTLSGLTRSVAALAKDGITDANEAIQILFDEIKNAPTDIEGTQKALEIFGTRAGPSLASAIREGKLEYQDLLTELQNGEETILGVAEETADWSEGLIKLKNNLMLAVEPLAGQLFEALNGLIPILMDVVGWVADLVQKFADLEPGTQKAILAFVGIAAAIGPVLSVVGRLVSGAGSLVSLFARFAPAAAGASAGAAGFSGVLAALTGPIGWIIAGLAALTAGGIALYKHLKEESIPEIERFSDAVSESTQESVGAFMDLHDEATTALNDLSWSGREVTKEMADEIVQTFGQMGDQVLQTMEESHAEELASMQEFFVNAQGITEEEQTEILEKVRQSQEDQQEAVKSAQLRIEEIMREASEEKRALTDAEAAEINRIQKDMLHTGIEMMSENELEQKAILERMRENAEALSARQAAEVVANSIEQKDKSIKAAEDQYNDVLKNIIRQRDELGTISKEQADKLIQEAQRQRDETVNRAKEMHQNVVTEAKQQAGAHVREVDWETGEVKTRWQRLKEDIGTTMTLMGAAIGTSWDNMLTSTKTKMGEIGESVKDKWNEIMEWLKGLGPKMLEIGKNIMDGLKDGIKNAASSVWEATKDVGRGVADSVTGFFQIRSPSRLMQGFGENIGEGLARGIKDSVSDVKRQAGELNAAVTPQFAGAGATTSSNVVNMDGLFAGATIVTRNDDDIRKLARDIWSMAQQSQRGGGGGR